MFTRKFILAFATVATLGTAALAATSAQASDYFGGDHVGGSRYAGNRSERDSGYQDRWHRCRYDCRESYGWHQPHYGMVDAAPTPAYAPVAKPKAAAPAGDCLHKKYLDDGSVVFWDSCAKEEAIATPEELKAQAKGDK
jgi:hypothetical protein